MTTNQGSIQLEEDTQETPHKLTHISHKNLVIKAVTAGLLIFLITSGVIYYLAKPQIQKQTIQQPTDKSVISSTPIPPVDVVKKVTYINTTEGEKVISTRIYNKNLFTPGVHDVPTANIIELENGFVLTEFAEGTQEKPNGNTLVWHYNIDTKKLSKPNLPEKYANGFDYASVIKYDGDSVVLDVAKYEPVNETSDPQTNETYIWNTNTNTTKNLAKLANACGSGIEDGKNYVCNMLNQIVPINKSEAIAVFSFGDACYSENVIYRYNLETDTVALIDSFSNSSINHKSLMGFYKGNMLIAELEKLPQRTENEFCPNTKTNKLYTMDANKKVVKDYDLSKLTTTENPFTDAMLGSDVTRITFSDDRYTSQTPTYYFLNLETEQINTSKAFPEYIWKNPEGTLTKEIPAPEETAKIKEIYEQTINNKEVVAGISSNGSLVQLFNSNVLESAKPEQIKVSEQRLKACGGVNYYRDILSSYEENATLIFLVSYELLPELRQTDSTMPEKVELVECAQTIPNYTATYRINTANSTLELVKLQEQFIVPYSKAIPEINEEQPVIMQDNAIEEEGEVIETLEPIPYAP